MREVDGPPEGPLIYVWSTPEDRNRSVTGIEGGQEKAKLQVTFQKYTCNENKEVGTE